MKVNDTFSSWALSYSGCDGGDIGSSESQSIWYCGIEWGGGDVDDSKVLQSFFNEPESTPPTGYKDWIDEHRVLQPAWKANLSYIFNWQAMKLLSAFGGRSADSYKSFAEEIKPFTCGEKGYYKLNLFPLAFKNTSPELWGNGFSEATGLQNKSEYVQWVRSYRLPVMRDWTRKHKPKTIICTGITYLEDFRSAFADNDDLFTTEEIEDRQLIWGCNKDGSVVFIIPFLVNRYGLTRNTSIQAFGDRMREIALAHTN